MSTWSGKAHRLKHIETRHKRKWSGKAHRLMSHEQDAQTDKRYDTSTTQMHTYTHSRLTTLVYPIGLDTSTYAWTYAHMDKRVLAMRARNNASKLRPNRAGCPVNAGWAATPACTRS